MKNAQTAGAEIEQVYDADEIDITKFMAALNFEASRRNYAWGRI